jgi:glutathione synthase/RimK-type ligase-like ATP-grasp enzyme
MSQFLGITREPVFSPGRVGDDCAILEGVADCLRQRGHGVTVFSGDDERWPEPSDGTIVFTMCQGEQALRRLQRWRAGGVRIVNTPEGILNCQRHRTVAALTEARVPFPDTVLVETNAEGL